MRPWGEEKGKKKKKNYEQSSSRKYESRSRQSERLNPGRSSSECAGKLPRGLEAEYVSALWQLFVSGRFRANWCKRHSQGLLHESTCSWGVGSAPRTLPGLKSNLFYVGMQTPLYNPRAWWLTHVRLSKLNVKSQAKVKTFACTILAINQMPVY